MEHCAHTVRLPSKSSLTVVCFLLWFFDNVAVILAWAGAMQEEWPKPWRGPNGIPCWGDGVGMEGKPACKRLPSHQKQNRPSYNVQSMQLGGPFGVVKADIHFATPVVTFGGLC